MFDLKLYFTGVMLFVVEDDQMHVLMPQTSEFVPAPVLKPDGSGSGDAGHGDTAGHGASGAGNGHPVEPHVARITFDTAYTRYGARAEDGAIAHVSMRKALLEIPRVGDAYSRGVPPEVVSVKRGVRAAVLNKTDTDSLAGRVHVASGKATGAGHGLCWEINGVRRRMAHQVEWTVSGIKADSLQFDMVGLIGEGEAGSGVPRLYPINGMIEVFIWHAPAFEIPPGAIMPAKPVPGDLNHHFSALDQLLEPAKEGEPELPVPVLVGDEKDCPGDDDMDEKVKTRGRDPDKGGASLTCTPGTTP